MPAVTHEDGTVVYLIDDDQGVRQSVREFLESAELNCVSFESAMDYLAYDRSDAAACLVLDLQLPGISGLELQAKLTETYNPPIVFITGRGDIPSTVKAMKGGAVEFLTKPVDAEILLAAVRAALERDRTVRSQRTQLSHLRERYALLSPREREVLPLVVSGLLNKQAAVVLGITEVTLQVHRGQIMRKMAAGSFAELVRMAGKLSIPLPE